MSVAACHCNLWSTYASPHMPRRLCHLGVSYIKCTLTYRCYTALLRLDKQAWHLVMSSRAFTCLVVSPVLNGR